jgi:hypothetical protein
MRVCREEAPAFHQPEPANRTACWLYDDGAARQLDRFRARDAAP